jgi:hypothetical protein
MPAGWPAFWPAQGPMWPDDNERDLTGGHPTVTGDLDKNIVRAGGPSPGNGVPGVPRVHPGPRHGPGMPGPTPSGPMSPGVIYDGSEEGGYSA